MKIYRGISFLVACLICFSASLQAREASFRDGYSLDQIKKETPAIAQMGAVSVENLKLNRQGNVAVVYPKEKIFAMLNISCDDEDDLDPYMLHQVLVGYEEVGAQKCVFNEFTYRLGNSITSFFLEAPEVPGIYSVQVQLEQSNTPVNAMMRWGDADTLQKTIGKVIVLEEQ